MNWFEPVRQSLVIIGGIGALTFPIYYWMTAPGWRTTPMGRFLMLGGLGWASLYLAAFVAILVPTEPVQNAIRLVLIVAAGSFAWYEVILYHRIRRQELARRKEEKERRGIDATE